MWLGCRTLATGYANRPGWFWLRERGEDGVATIFGVLASSDGSETVRQGAMRLLALTGTELPEPFDEQDFFADVLADESEAVRQQAIEYLIRRRPDNAIELLDAAVSRQPLVSRLKKQSFG